MKHLITILALSLTILGHAQQQNQNQRQNQNNRNNGQGFQNPWAQGYRPMTLSGGLFIGEPIGEFDQTFGRELIGVGGNFAVPMRRLPFESGLTFNWGSMGGDDDIIALDSSFASNEGTMQVKANMYAVHGMIRLNPLKGGINPYFDLLGGFRTFSTRTKVKIDDVSGSVINERNERDFTWSYGWAAGLMYTVTSNLYVEGRFEKLKGGNVSYVDSESIQISPNGLVQYQSRTSKSDMFNIVLGFGFKF